MHTCTSAKTYCNAGAQGAPPHLTCCVSKTGLPMWPHSAWGRNGGGSWRHSAQPSGSAPLAQPPRLLVGLVPGAIGHQGTGASRRCMPHRATRAPGTHPHTARWVVAQPTRVGRRLGRRGGDFERVEAITTMRKVGLVPLIALTHISRRCNAGFCYRPIISMVRATPCPTRSPHQSASRPNTPDHRPR